jgi:hypothetical protein
MNVFNLTDSQNVSEMLKEGVDYVVVKDGNGAETKVVNLGNPDICIRKGFIEIEAMKQSHKHDNAKLVRRVRDKSTNLYIGVPTSISSETKELQWKGFWIDSRMSFDLSIPDQAIAWHVIKNSQYVEGSPNQQGKSIWKVIDKEVNAHKDIIKRKLRSQAEAIIETLHGSALVETAVNLGVNVEANASVFMLTSEVYRMMEMDPKGFIDLHNDPNREYVSVFNKGIAKGKIVQDMKTGSFIYGNIPMGYNKETAIKFLVDNTGMAASINAKCDQEDIDSKKSMEATGNNSPKSNSKEVDMQRKIMELEAELAKSKSVEAFIPPFGLVDDKAEEPLVENEKSELDSLRKKAKDLKIQGAHLASKETLIARIAEAEAK